MTDKRMFVYVFGRYFGGDKVARWPAAGDFGVQAGDVVRLRGDYMLCLGETCAFSETVTYEIAGVMPSSGAEPAGSMLELHIRSVFSEQGLAMLHRFVEHRYTTYHKAVPLWLGGDDHIEVFLRGAPKKPISKKKTKTAGGGQKLIVVPDLWTAQAVFPDVFLTGSIGGRTGGGGGGDESGFGGVLEGAVLALHGQSTDKQKRDAFRSFKAGKYMTLVCTPSQMFQDWADLKSIVLLDQHKRRYKSQQDPRYDAVRVAQIWAKKAGAELVMTGSVLDSEK